MNRYDAWAFVSLLLVVALLAVSGKLSEGAILRILEGATLAVGVRQARSKVTEAAEGSKYENGPPKT